MGRTDGQSLGQRDRRVSRGVAEDPAKAAGSVADALLPSRIHVGDKTWGRPVTWPRQQLCADG
ncbi:hypothetical protein BCD48_27890 [Pseudofrankia sp. BMG5.36]|nr:hypothetical protein BCD48_27890 [Pseudofrankia sp. BMG5.36]